MNFFAKRINAVNQMLLPRVPATADQARLDNTRRKVVMNLSAGNVSAQVGKFTTRQDRQAQRVRVLSRLQDAR